MKTCPACNHPNDGSIQCEKCNKSLLPEAPERTSGASAVAQMLGVRPQDPSRPVEVTLSPKPVPLVAPPEQKRRTWLLFSLFAALVLLYVQVREDDAQRPARNTPSADASPPVDEGFLDLAFESMLAEAHTAFELRDDKGAARLLQEQLLARTADFEKRLKSARLSERQRESYEEAAAALRAFVEDTLPVALDREDEAPSEEPDAPLELAEAQRAFDRARAP